MARNYQPQQQTGARRRNKRREKWNKPSQHTTTPSLATVELVSTRSLQRGVVVWAHIPFAEGNGEKTRPEIGRAHV